eukprot:GHVU01230318.1.p1 GENE.GHVU01230318.1~~GHVU01230318.1.p1  ORF type:complete len:196 (-),score=22.34 GHVU01230318.1:1355-1942(-)
MAAVIMCDYDIKRVDSRRRYIIRCHRRHRNRHHHCHHHHRRYHRYHQETISGMEQVSMENAIDNLFRKAQDKDTFKLKEDCYYNEEGLKATDSVLDTYIRDGGPRMTPEWPFLWKKTDNGGQEVTKKDFLKVLEGRTDLNGLKRQTIKTEIINNINKSGAPSISKQQAQQYVRQFYLPHEDFRNHVKSKDVCRHQ